MSRKCKPGQRARIVSGGTSKGKVVMVVGPWRHGSEYGGSENWAPYLFPWKTVSLSGPIRIIDVKTGEFLRNSVLCVFEDAELEPLDDDDDGLIESTEKDKPIKKPRAVRLNSKEMGHG